MISNYFVLSFISAYFIYQSDLVSAYSYGKSGSKCPQGSECRFALNCPGIALIGKNIGEANNQLCLYNGKQIGVCCLEITETENTRGSETSPIRVRRDEIVLTLPRLAQKSLDELVEQAKERDLKLQAKETEIYENTEKSPSKPDSPEKAYQRNLGYQANISAISRSKEAHFLHQLGIVVAKKLNLKSPSQVNSLKKLALPRIVNRESCSPNITCTPSKYRTVDGSCNNLDHPAWGKSVTPYVRVLLPQYGDGIDSPKVAKSGKDLPPARVVSYNVAKDRPATSPVLDTLFLAYGQWLDHDLTQVIGSTLPDGGAITCCDPLLGKPQESSHPACFPIIIPDDDPFFSQFGVRCQNFVRTAIAPPSDCKLGPRGQVNNLTPWVDGSIIYGSDDETARHLRSFKGGKLAMKTTEAGAVLTTSNGSCYRDINCFEGADSRVNQQPGLMAIHIVWAREHNRIAEELRNLNPDWNDETLYQETRRIVTAEFQHITYNEFLSLVVGPNNMRKYGLYSLRKGFSTEYNKNMDPSIIMEFSSAAFRLHTLIPPTIEVRDGAKEKVKSSPLSSNFNNPSVFYKAQAYEKVVNGLTTQATCAADNLYSTAITNHLFPADKSPWGSDLFSIDIQRGRDHGLAGYNDWREACGVGRVSSFQELNGTVYPESIPVLEELYESVDDIDVVVGMNVELRPDGMAVGPTAACIITDTFRRFKFADRFWYENGGEIHSFNEDQLNAIRNVTFARMLCDNSHIKDIQEMAFIQPVPSNPRVNCEDLSSKSLNLLLWQNEPTTVSL